MKIAFDLRRIKNPGIGRYMKCLVEAVVESAPEHEYLLILPPGEEEAVVVCTGTNVEKITPSLKYYSLREQVDLPRILHKKKIDLLHSPHFNIPLIRVCPMVVTIHDVIYLACREDLPSFVGRMYYRAMMAAAVRRADRIITDSEYSKRDIQRFFKAEDDRLDVIYPGVDQSIRKNVDSVKLCEVKSRLGIVSPYLIYTGIYKLRKNHAGLLQAFKTFVDKGGHAQLVIAGPMEDGEEMLRRLAQDLGVADRVVFTGFVEHGDLPALYSGASVYACPSLYEGFGFTVLEAMACGVPVVCSRETSLPEVAGAAALYADARNPQEFGNALYQVFRDQALRAMLVNKGMNNLQRFQWKHAAERTLAVYEKAARGTSERVLV
jgi:glycosyltransferase involved in cell wall biosynthesis